MCQEGSRSGDSGLSLFADGRDPMSKKIFISHRNVGDDLVLAKTLHRDLEQFGHDVFLDAADLQLGDEWPTVIQRELESADVLIVLLSRHIATHPDMVIEEVSMAKELRRRQQGRPTIMPVCIGADAVASLPYDLAAMIKRLQYTVWSGPRDTRPLMSSLLEALDPDASKSRSRGSYDKGRGFSISRGPEESDFPFPGDDLSVDEPKRALSLGVGDERPLPQPPKTPYSSEWYVSRSDAERQAAALLREPGSPVVLVGPDDIGKSYLLEHLIKVHQQEDDRVVRIDLADALDAEEDLFQELAFQIAEQLELGDETIDKAWERKRRRPTNVRLRHFMEASGLVSLTGRLFLVVDRTDAVAQSEAAKSLFRELRAWAERSGRSEPWDRLRLLLAISTEPDRLTDALESSPLDISPPVRLHDLDRDQLLAMASCYGLELRDNEVDMLMDLIGGHPYLARIVMYRAASGGRPVNEILLRATDPEGLFADHLRSRMLKVRRDDQLASAVRFVIQGDRDPIDAEVAHRLLSSGLITGSPGAYRMRYKLYGDYFREWLRS